MHPWQTLTLAKIEANASTFATTTEQIQVAKHLLLDIDLQHFFEPEIDYCSPPTGYDDGRHDLVLRWAIDGRKVFSRITPWQTGVCMVIDRRGEPGVEGLERLAAWSTQDAVQYLLSGRVPSREIQAGLV